MDAWLTFMHINRVWPSQALNGRALNGCLMLNLRLRKAGPRARSVNCFLSDHSPEAIGASVKLHLRQARVAGVGREAERSGE